MLSAVVVVLLVAAFVLVAGVAGWVVRRLWTAPAAADGTAARAAAEPPTAQEG